MSQLLERIKDDQLESRKKRNARKTAALTTLIGDIEAKQKKLMRSILDAEVVSTVTTFIANAKETSMIAEDYGDQLRAYELIEEVGWYQVYMPRQFTEDELHHAIQRILQEMDELDGTHSKPKMGDVLKTLKFSYGGQYDGALAARLVKEALA